MATLPIHELDWSHDLDGDMPIEALAIVKVMDSDGNVYIAYRHTSALRSWDLLGLLRSMQLDVEKQSVAETFPVEDDDAGE